MQLQNRTRHSATGIAFTNRRVKEALGYRIEFQLPFNNIKWLSDYSRRWQVKV